MTRSYLLQNVSCHKGLCRFLARLGFKLYRLHSSALKWPDGLPKSHLFSTHMASNNWKTYELCEVWIKPDFFSSFPGQFGNSLLSLFSPRLRNQSDKEPKVRAQYAQASRSESATVVVDLSRGDPSFVLRNEGSEERLKGNHSVLRVRSYFFMLSSGFS